MFEFLFFVIMIALLVAFGYSVYDLMVLIPRRKLQREIEMHSRAPIGSHQKLRGYEEPVEIRGHYPALCSIHIKVSGSSGLTEMGWGAFCELQER